jgi:Domain of unknown function (DUF4124)
MRKYILNIVLYTLVLSYSSNVVAIYKCKDANGHVTYSQTKCIGNSEVVRGISRSKASETEDFNSDTVTNPPSPSDISEYETEQKNMLHGELVNIRMGNGDPKREAAIRLKLWEIDEEWYQRYFDSYEDLKKRYIVKLFQKSGSKMLKNSLDDITKQLCRKYRYRKEELSRGVNAGYIVDLSKSTRLSHQYERGIRENCSEK